MGKSAAEPDYEQCSERARQLAADAGVDALT